jgi:hypothetical protein
LTASLLVSGFCYSIHLDALYQSGRHATASSVLS